MDFPRVRETEKMMGSTMDFDLVAMMVVGMVPTWLGPLMVSTKGSGRASQWDSYLEHSMAWNLERFHSRGKRMYEFASHTQMHSSPVQRTGPGCRIGMSIDLDALERSQKDN
jgi:hypothetical protein